MDYKNILIKLEELKVLIEKYNNNSADESKNELKQQICEMYGEVEDVIESLTGRMDVQVPGHQGAMIIYPNFIEAGYLSGRTNYAYQGYNQLLKIIGKVRQLAENPPVFRDERSIGSVVQVLQRFRECCQYVQTPPENEQNVQDIVWIMLRSHFDRLDRESTLPKFGVKAYIPDFGIPELHTLIEVKYIGLASKLALIQEEVLADIPGYLSKQGNYNGIIVFVYDATHKLRDPVHFIEDLRNVDGIIDVIVIPGVT